jgi:hypothetical protein
MAELEEADLWKVLKSVKTEDDYWSLFHKARSFDHQIDKFCNGNVQAMNRLRAYAANMYALGAVRGVQFGSILGKRVENTIAASLTRHASVRRLLTAEPKVSTPEVCKALDKVNEPLPWPKLSRKSRFWVDHAKTSTVKMAITLARREARQTDTDEQFTELIRAVGGGVSGGGGPVFDQFEFVKRAVGKRRK